MYVKTMSGTLDSGDEQGGLHELEDQPFLQEPSFAPPSQERELAFRTGPMKRGAFLGYVCGVLTVVVISMALVIVSMIVSHVLFAAYPSTFTWIISYIRYDIILIILLAIHQILALILISTQITFRVGTIWGVIMFGLYVIMTCVFGAIIGLALDWVALLIAVIATLVVFLATIVFIGIVYLCNIYTFIRQLEKGISFFRFGLLFTSLTLFVMAFNFESHSNFTTLHIFFGILLVIILFLMLILVLGQFFDRRSKMSRRGNFVEAIFIIFSLMTTILFGSVVLLFSTGLTVVTNDVVAVNVATASKPHSVELEKEDEELGVPKNNINKFKRMRTTMYKLAWGGIQP